jgi:hypothetical protein
MKNFRSLALAILVMAVICFHMADTGYGQNKTPDKVQEKISIGMVEDVIFLPWGVKLPARIDTGAATTSLDARDLVVTDDIAEFRMPRGHGDVKIRLPIVDWRHIRSSGGRQRRPVVEMEICMGPKKLLVRVNLNDRSRMRYPVIVGRNVLKEGFAVDCECTHILKPSCPEAQIK